MKMTMAEDFAIRRGTKIYCVEAESSPVIMLRVCPWQAKEWMLPWSRFESSNFGHEEDSERVEIFFPHHHVIAIGKHLQAMADDIREFQIRCIRDLPESRCHSFAPTEPFISRLEVRVLNAPKNRPADGLPF